jgi:Domain of Unknown Function (DUF748)
MSLLSFPRGARIALAAMGVAGLLVLGLQLALRQLPARVAAALGPQASVRSIELGWTGVEVRGLVVKGVPGRWPAEHELRADRVTIRPALSSLWRDGWQLASVQVHGGYVAMLRTRDGRLRVVPSLRERDEAGTKPGRAAPSAPHVRIESLVLDGVAVDVFDATVGRGAPHRLQLTDVTAEAGPLALPALDERIDLRVEARLGGAPRNGRIDVRGALTPATREADLRVQARGLDLRALQPYLLRNGEGAVRAGTLDLDLRARAAGGRLDAPGRVVLDGLELQGGGGLLGTFAGVPRQAVLAAMSRDGRIEMEFKLEGRIDDPQFSINELFAARFAVGLAEKLGVSLGGVVEGVGSIVKGLFGR